MSAVGFVLSVLGDIDMVYVIVRVLGTEAIGSFLSGEMVTKIFIGCGVLLCLSVAGLVFCIRQFVIAKKAKG